jgi:hypothetical protein
MGELPVSNPPADDRLDAAEVLLGIDREGSTASSKAKRPELKIQHDTIKAADLVSYFVKGYEGGAPEDYEWFYDCAKSTFVLKLYIRAK